MNCSPTRQRCFLVIVYIPYVQTSESSWVLKALLLFNLYVYSILFVLALHISLYLNYISYSLNLSFQLYLCK